MKLIDGALCQTGYRGTAWRRDARYRNWIIHEKERNEENEKGNLEDDSADHRDCTHCTLHITRSYELHAVHVETG